MQEFWQATDRDEVRHKYGEDFELAFAQWKVIKKYRSKLHGAGLQFQRGEITQKEYWRLTEANELEWENSLRRLESQYAHKFTY